MFRASRRARDLARVSAEVTKCSLRDDIFSGEVWPMALTSKSLSKRAVAITMHSWLDGESLMMSGGLKPRNLSPLNDPCVCAALSRSAYRMQSVVPSADLMIVIPNSVARSIALSDAFIVVLRSFSVSLTQFYHGFGGLSRGLK